MFVATTARRAWDSRKPTYREGGVRGRWGRGRERWGRGREREWEGEGGKGEGGGSNLDEGVCEELDRVVALAVCRAGLGGREERASGKWALGESCEVKGGGGGGEGERVWSLCDARVSGVRRARVRPTCGRRPGCALLSVYPWPNLCGGRQPLSAESK